MAHKLRDSSGGDNDSEGFVFPLPFSRIGYDADDCRSRHRSRIPIPKFLHSKSEKSPTP